MPKLSIGVHDTTIAPCSAWRTVLLLLAYSICSSLLLILNKRALLIVGAPPLLLLYQCCFAVICLAFANVLGLIHAIQPMSDTERKRFFVVVALFVVTLFANMKSLQIANVDTVICLRMTAPLILSVLDYLFLGRRLPTMTSLFSLLAISASFSSFLIFTDELSDFRAIFWLALWYSCMIVETVYVKFVVMQSTLSTAGQAFYQNLYAIPILFIIAVSVNDIDIHHDEGFSLFPGLFLIVTTCALGLGMSYLSFAVREQISATSFSVLGNVCKLATILINLLIWDKHASAAGTLSVMFCIFSSAFYKQAPLRPSTEVSEDITIGKNVLRENVAERITVVVVASLLATGLWIESAGYRAEDGAADISGVSGNLFQGVKQREYRHRYVTKPSLAADSPFHKATKCERWAVCTTIFDESEAVHDVCRRLPSYCLVVVADKKSKETYHVDGGCTFIYLTVRDQEQIARSSPFALQTPWNHFGRKNLGYLFAIANGARVLWDFDDDNLLITSSFLGDESLNGQKLVTLQGAATSINPYPLLGAENFSWPRGFPLEQIKNGSTLPRQENLVESQVSPERIGIVQALANHDPDVDAIYRLQREIPFSFQRMSNPFTTFVVPTNSFIPLNAQATLFMSRESLWTIYLPISVHGRVSDIWRSYIAQRLLRNACIHVAFAVEPLVIQKRNPHSYLADFDAEQDLYYKSGKLVEFLSEWSSNFSRLPEQAIDLYVQLFERNYIGRRDVEMLELWLLELERTGYEFPEICVGGHARRIT